MDPSHGDHLGTYEILSRIGAGGMGVVYRARDPRLGREVAIKVLHEDLTSDEQLMARFSREARLLAALSHPNIAVIHGLEETDDITFLVLELVEGETLADRLKKKPLPTRQAIDVCRQIAEALEAAHEKGIIHRDLKPANVKLTGDGRVKVLDFGLAKTVMPETGCEDEATLTHAATQFGVLVGTPHYMSPEQVRGEPLDRRSDIWAFGCVSYEVLSGRRVVDGETMTNVLAAVLLAEPDWSKLPSGLDPAVLSLLKRCLQKEKRSRLQDIGDARIELEEVLGLRQPTRPGTTPVRSQRWKSLVALTSVAVALASIALVGWKSWDRAVEAPPPVTKFSIAFSPGERLVTSFNPSLAISPDGRTLFYFVPTRDQGEGVGTGPVTEYVRRLDELDSKTLPYVTGGCPVFSPDSRWLSLCDYPGVIKRAPLDGGPSLTITPFEWIYRGDWGADGFLYWTPGTRSGIVRTPITGGETEIVTELDTSRNEQSHRFARLLPNGKAILFAVAETTMESFDDARIDVQSLQTGTRKTLIEGGTGPLYSPSGHLLYARAGNLYAAPFDLDTLETTGPPRLVLHGVLMSTNTGVTLYSLSQTGTLAYAPGGAEGGQRQVVWVDRRGRETPLPLPPRSYLYPRLSPDGDRLAIEVEGPSHDLYVYDFARTVLTKMTHDGLSHAPVWSPDGMQIGFRSWKLGGMTIWSLPADRSGQAKQLLEAGGMQSVVSWSPDGNFIAYTDFLPGRGFDVLVLPMRGEPIPMPVARSEFIEGSPKFSPDGKWLAYCSDESGRAEVYVQPFPGPGPKIQLSSDGGTDPLWQRAGKEIYYRNGHKMMVVEVRNLTPFQAGAPRTLWEGHYSHGMSSSCGQPGVTSFNYDVTPDGSRFLMIKDLDQDMGADRIIVVLNWTHELSHLMGPGTS